jgi:alkylation response protein AidB-like acyl-CoA dehydrogenase
VTTEDRDLLRSLADDVLAPIASATRAGSPELGSSWELLLELGWPVAGLAEEAGGAGGDTRDVLVLAEALGRNAVCLPLIEAQAASAVLAAAGRTAGLGERLPVETSPRHSSLRLVRDRGIIRVTGTVRRTPWARHADTLLIRAPSRAGLTWIACDLPNPSVTITPGSNLAGEPRDDVAFHDLALPASESWDSFDDSPVALGMLLRCAAITGALDATVTLTRRYVRERQQFGRPLASLQTVGQAVAMMSARLSAARAALEAAAQSPTTANVLAAHVDLADFASKVARTAHDLHGAMGVTREYALHSLTTRLWSWPEEGVRQLAARAELGQQVADGGVPMLWARVIS